MEKKKGMGFYPGVIATRKRARCLYTVKALGAKRQRSKSTETKAFSSWNVVYWDREMSKYNMKTLNFDAYKVYLEHKNTLAAFYNEYLFQKLKLGSELHEANNRSTYAGQIQ